MIPVIKIIFMTEKYHYNVVFYIAYLTWSKRLFILDPTAPASGEHLQFAVSRILLGPHMDTLIYKKNSMVHSSYPLIHERTTARRHIASYFIYRLFPNLSE